MKFKLTGPRTRHFEYRDKEGQLLYRVVRRDYRSGSVLRKKVWQEVSHGKGEWRRGDGVMEGINRVPYALGRVQGRSRVVWVEGEKCAEALLDADIAATTAVGGAAGFKEGHRYIEQLQSLGVEELIVLPDQDKAGFRYATKVVHAADEHGLRVKEVRLPLTQRGDDVVEYLEDHTPEELLALIETVPWFEPPPDEQATVSLDTVAPQQIECLYDPYIPLAKVTVLDGHPGEGKGLWTTTIAAYLASGTPLPLPRQVQSARLRGSQPPQRTLFVSIEDGIADTQRVRVEAQLRTLGCRDKKLIRALSHVRAWKQLLRFEDKGYRNLEREIRRYGIRLLVLDSAYSFVDARVDMYRENEIRPILQALGDIASRTNCALLFVRHHKKGSGRGDHILHRGIGSIAVIASARSGLALVVNPKNRDERVLIHTKCNFAKKGLPLVFAIRDGVMTYRGTSDLSEGQLIGVERLQKSEQAVGFLRSVLVDKPMAATQIFALGRQAGLSETTLRRARGAAGVVSHKQSTKGGTRGEGYWVWKLKDGGVHGQSR